MKMPEPVAHCSVRPLQGDESVRKFEINWAGADPVAGPLYDKQALIDLLEEAAKECENRDSGQGLREDLEDIACAAAIRKLKETL